MGTKGVAIMFALIAACEGKDETSESSASAAKLSEPATPKPSGSSTTPTPSKGSATPAGSATLATGSGSGAGTAAGSAAVAEPVPAVEPLPPPLKTQLDYKLTGVKFLGWSEDGRMFVIEATHGLDLGEMGGANLLRLRQVHDAVTGKMIDSYQISRTKDRSVKPSDKLSVAHAEAKKPDQWKMFQQNHPLVGTAPALGSPEGAWKVKFPKPKLKGQEALKITAKQDRLVVRWEGFGGDGGGQDDDPWEDHDPTPAKPKAGKSPTIKLQIANDTATWEHLVIRIPFGAKEILEVAEEKPHVSGTITAHWAPQRNRVVWLTTFTVNGINEESPMHDSRFYVRAVGPQLKVLDAGGGHDKALATVNTLEAAGMGVTGLERSDKESPKSKVYFRGGAKSIAETVATKLGAAFTVEEIKKPGWVDVIVQVGQ